MAAIAQGIERRTARGNYARSALCPTHNATSTRFLGVQAEGWVFRCPRGEHNFLATPAARAPAGKERKTQRQGRRKREKANWLL